MKKIKRNQKEIKWEIQILNNTKASREGNILVNILTNILDIDTYIPVLTKVTNSLIE